MKLIGWLLFYISKLKNLAIHTYLSHKYSSTAKKIGGNVRFNGMSKITGLEQCIIGDNVHIGENAFIRGEGGLTIGNNTHFARNVVIYTHNHNYQGKRLPYDDTFNFKEVQIGKNVWIGINVTILPGTTIGDGAIIGAGAVVSGEILPQSIIGAAKGQQIKSRDKAHYEKLNTEKSFGGKNGEQYEG